jgi:hypothetical protein
VIKDTLSIAHLALSVMLELLTKKTTFFFFPILKAHLMQIAYDEEVRGFDSNFKNQVQ